MILRMEQDSVTQIEMGMSEDARSVLRSLANRKNVLLTGPPGTGKSRLLNEIRELFQAGTGLTAAYPTASIPLPPAPSPLPEWFPSPSENKSRKVFQTVFDQNTKYRDFLRGLAPKIGEAGAFEVTKGTLYRAAVHAAFPGNATLVIIDEINRGPAVAAFGSAIVGLEADKRLPSGGIATKETQFFEVLNDEGEAEEFALPEDLYILGAMNEADTSVEPLDVAFLRRFHTHQLIPDSHVLRQHLSLGTPRSLPATATEASDYYEALAQAFDHVNDQIFIGRGQAYQLGHGALMHKEAPEADTVAAQEYVADAWSTLRAHLGEVFFGNTPAIAEILQAGNPASVYEVREEVFAGQSVRKLDGPIRPNPAELYALLRSIANS